jgi:hypothetical protein
VSERAAIMSKMCFDDELLQRMEHRRRGIATLDMRLGRLVAQFLEIAAVAQQVSVLRDDNDVTKPQLAGKGQPGIWAVGFLSR